MNKTRPERKNKRTAFSRVLLEEPYRDSLLTLYLIVQNILPDLSPTVPEGQIQQIAR